MTSYLISAHKQFEYYKSLGDTTLHRLTLEELQKEFSKDSNSIAIIVKHLSGNMLSRWTNFMTEDGEKVWRQRDEEFTDSYFNKETIIQDWEKGWQCLFKALNDLESKDLEALIYIRNQGHTVMEAINRQLTHYAYHIGQMVLLAKIIKGNEWQSLSIPKGKSKEFNADKFKFPKERRHFTDLKTKPKSS